MRKLVLIAAMLMASASAHAGSFSFNIEGQKVRVSIPRGCASLSCINVKAPGLTDKFKDSEDTASTPATTATAPAAAPAPQAVAPAAPVAPVAAAPAPAAPQTSSKVTVLAAPEAPAAAPTAPVEALAQPAPAPIAAPAPAPIQIAAAPAPAAAPPAPAPAAVQTAVTPVGLWMSEKKEGKVRIEECGANLCGYAVDAKTGANGAKVLINMKPRGEKWAGRIHDTRNGGTYDSTIALRGTDKLKVQGCAFGGMFCGGETWTRIE